MHRHGQDGIADVYLERGLHDHLHSVRHRAIKDHTRLSMLPVGVHLLASATPQADERDLVFLADRLAQAKVLGLGEATHGSKELGQIRERLIEALVHRSGAVVIALETNPAGCEDIDHYLKTGEGDPVRLVGGLGQWMWDTEELVDLVRRLRAIEASGGVDIAFSGFDIQDVADQTKEVIDWARVHAPDCAEEIAGALSDGPEEAGRCRRSMRSAADVYSWLMSADVGRRPPDDHVVHSARILALHEQMEAAGPERAQNIVRDRAMAENVEWIVDHSSRDATVVLWAHNGHVAKSQGLMGGYLNDVYGSSYLAIATTTYEGTYRALGMYPHPSLGVHQIAAAPRGSVEGALHSLGEAVLFLDVREAMASCAHFVSPTMMMLDIGAITDDHDFFRARLTRFDGIAFIDETTASRSP